MIMGRDDVCCADAKAVTRMAVPDGELMFVQAPAVYTPRVLQPNEGRAGKTPRLHAKATAILAKHHGDELKFAVSLTPEVREGSREAQ